MFTSIFKNRIVFFLAMDIVIVEPEIPGNLGAIARAMKNFAFHDLVVVNPRFDMRSEELKNRAKHANDILDDAKIVDSVNELDYDYRIGTSGKLSSDYNLKRTPVTPRELKENIKNIDGKRIAIFFGRESHGLTNEELEMMDFIVNIPANDEYGVLNLSHAVSIILYELYNGEGSENLNKRYRPIGDTERKTIESLHDDIVTVLDFGTESKKRIQKTLWRKMIAKSTLSNREAFALIGLLRRIRDNLNIKK